MISARYVVGAVGLFGTVLALALAFAPASAASAGTVGLLTAALPTDRPGALLAGVGLVLGLAATTLARVGASDTSPPLVSVPPERATSNASTPGDGFDRALDRPDGEDDSLCETLRTTAVETLVQYTDSDRQAARTAVQRGTWTDDPLAGALLGAQRFPFSSRLRSWLDPAAERRRRADRTIEAIEALQREEGASS